MSCSCSIPDLCGLERAGRGEEWRPLSHELAVEGSPVLAGLEGEEDLVRIREVELESTAAQQMPPAMHLSDAVQPASGTSSGRGSR